MKRTKKTSCTRCLGRSVCWCEPANLLPESALDFSQETSLHGLKYICQPKRHLCERIFWLITLIGGGIAAGLLIVRLWMEYSHVPIVTFSSKETTIEQIPFPAVTIYNSNLFRRSRLQNVVKDLTKPDRPLPKSTYTRLAGLVVLVRYICNNETTFGQRMNFTYLRDTRNVRHILDSLEDIFQKMSIQNKTSGRINNYFHLLLLSHQCTDMIKNCQFNDQVVNCEDHFKHEATLGKEAFCSFNSVPGYTFTSNKATLINDLNALNQTTMDILDKYEKQRLVWSNDLINKDGLLLSTRKDAANAVFPGNLSQKHNWYTPKRQRNKGKAGGLSLLLDPELHDYTCGMSDSEGFLLQVHPPTYRPNGKDEGIFIKPNTEVSVEVTPSVTLANPNLINIPIEHRNCYFQNEKPLNTSWFYTLDLCIDECISNFTKEECDCDLTRHLYTYSKLCTLKNFICALDRIKLLSRNEYAETCNCLPLCTTVEYTTRVTTSEIDSGYHMMSCKDVGDYENGTIFNRRNNLSIVHIYFAEDFVYARERKQMYGLVDFIANAGGVLGLCLGFSVLSLLECIYFLTFRVWCRYRRKRTFSEIVSANMARLLERSRQTNAIPENRPIQFAINKFVEEAKALQEMLTKKEPATEEPISVLD